MLPVSIFLLMTALDLRPGSGKSNPRDLLSILSCSPGPGVTGRPQSPNFRVINIACLDASCHPASVPRNMRWAKGQGFEDFITRSPVYSLTSSHLFLCFGIYFPLPLPWPTPSCFSLNLSWPTLSQVWVKEAYRTPTSSKVYSDRECLSGSSQSPQHLYRVWKQYMHIYKLNAYRREYEPTEYLMRGNRGSSGQR